MYQNSWKQCHFIVTGCRGVENVVEKESFYTHNEISVSLAYPKLIICDLIEEYKKIVSWETCKFDMWLKSLSFVYFSV